MTEYLPSVELLELQLYDVVYADVIGQMLVTRILRAGQRAPLERLKMRERAIILMDLILLFRSYL